MEAFFLLKLFGLAVEHLVEADSTHLSHGVGVAHFGEGADSGFHHAVGVGGTFGLGEHVLDAHALKDGTHSTAGDDTGTGSSGFHEDVSTAVLAFTCVRDSSLQDGHLDEVLLRIFHAFGDGGRDFTGLTKTIAYDTVLITNDHDDGETEDSTTLGHFSHSVGGDHALFEFEVSCFYFLDIFVSHSSDN